MILVDHLCAQMLMEITNWLVLSHLVGKDVQMPQFIQKYLIMRTGLWKDLLTEINRQFDQYLVIFADFFIIKFAKTLSGQKFLGLGLRTIFQPVCASGWQFQESG